MKYMMYMMAFVSAWFSCTVPAAVGFYWIISTILGFLQTVVMNIWYSPDDLNAESEARRIVLREQEEAAMQPVLQHMAPEPAGQKKAEKHHR